MLLRKLGQVLAATAGKHKPTLGALSNYTQLDYCG
jgi:hypothetical protein